MTAPHDYARRDGKWLDLEGACETTSKAVAGGRVIVNGAGVRIQLRLAGLEPPVAPQRNWVIVEGRVVEPRGEWSFTAPCLEDVEVLDLASWLRRSARGDVEAGDVIEFTEPTLSVGLVEQADDSARIRVLFGHEALPPFARQLDDYLPGENFRPEPVEFWVRRDELERASGELLQELRVLGVEVAGDPAHEGGS